MKKIAQEARNKVLDMVYNAQTSHIGSNFSVIDIFAVLFEKLDFKKDKLVLSAGWKAASLYYFLHTKGFITEEELDSYCQPGSPFIGLSEPLGRFGLEFAGGSMGYGLPAGVGFAIAKKLNKEKGIVYVVMSDGEMACGTTWEAALIASHHLGERLKVIVDYNQFQAMGLTNRILQIEPLTNKWEAFGWDVILINGHNYKQIETALDWKTTKGSRPVVIIANTTKGKGVSFMEGQNLWHYKAPNEDEYLKAKQELNG